MKEIENVQRVAEDTAEEVKSLLVENHINAPISEIHETTALTNIEQTVVELAGQESSIPRAGIESCSSAVMNRCIGSRQQMVWEAGLRPACPITNS